MEGKKYTIYAIQCTVNQKLYIGATRQELKSRIMVHLSKLRKDKHSNKLLQDDFKKYGEDKFCFYELETDIPYANKDKERFYMDKYKTYIEDRGYNKDDNYFRKSKEIKIIKGLPKVKNNHDLIQIR